MEAKPQEGGYPLPNGFYLVWPEEREALSFQVIQKTGLWDYGPGD